MPEENTNEKKKQKVAILIGVVTLLIAVLGATYAFFQISTDTSSSNTAITGSTPANGLVTLKGVTSNLHLNISASDMSLNNVNNEYYGTDVEEKSYEENESDGTKTIAEVELTGGDSQTKYSCTAKLTVSKVTDPLEEADTMIEVLQPGDMILQFKGNIISKKLDLSDLKETGSKEYDLNFKISGDKPEAIQAYIKLVNKETQQNYLSGKKLNIDISTSDLKCNVYIEHPTIAELRAKDKEVSEGVEHLSTNLQGGMYRYQGTYNVPNWICFGTTDKNQCTDETDSDSNNIPDGIDKYMYRIIGITEEGQMYLIKETSLKEDEKDSFAWNAEGYLPDCLGEACEWPNSDLYMRLNGEASNGNPIFVNSTPYDYLKSGEENGKNDGIGSEWYQLIADHNWMYGDTYTSDDSIIYNGNSMYAIETGGTATTRYWPDEEQGQTTCGVDVRCTEKPYTWSKSTDATKIGLMYMHDVDYAYANCSSGECIERGVPGNGRNVENSWIHFRTDRYNNLYGVEWLMTRWGAEHESSDLVKAVALFDTGQLIPDLLSNGKIVRPVFYLTSDVKIKEGTDGTKSNPYILDIQEA